MQFYFKPVEVEPPHLSDLISSTVIENVVVERSREEETTPYTHEWKYSVHIFFLSFTPTNKRTWTNVLI